MGENSGTWSLRCPTGEDVTELIRQKRVNSAMARWALPTTTAIMCTRAASRDEGGLPNAICIALEQITTRRRRSQHGCRGNHFGTYFNQGRSAELTDFIRSLGTECRYQAPHGTMAR